jgi:hypothetical protein
MSQLPTMKVSLLKYVRKMNNYITLQEIKKPPCPGATRRVFMARWATGNHGQGVGFSTDAILTPVQNENDGR